MILNNCRNEFDENIYVIDTTKRATQERSNVLQEEDENISLEEKVCEEDDKRLSLGMPMQPQEEDNEEQEDVENDEQLENEERKLPPFHHLWMRVTLKMWLMINFAFMILMMRKNINLCL